MNEHTPGPWKVLHKKKYNEWHVSVPAENSGMRVSLFPDGVPGDTDKEMEGNARLIAAAPDMHRWLSAVRSNQCVCGAHELDPAEHVQYCPYRRMTGG